MRRLGQLGRVDYDLDPTNTLVRAGRERDLEQKNGLTRKAMGVIASFSAVEYAADVAYVYAIWGDPTAAYTAVQAIRSDGPRTAAIDALMTKYVAADEDREALSRLSGRTERARRSRNMIAHSLWCSITEHPEFIAMVDPRLLAGELAQNAAEIASLVRRQVFAWASIPGVRGPAFERAVLVDESCLDSWIKRNVALESMWKSFHSVVSGRGMPPRLRAQLRLSLRTRLGESQSEP
jgi:hypothetical protein